MKVDWLIVGAGFTGATLAERIASQLDKRVLVIDRRDHIGGNAYDEYNEHGILVHRYGPHIFHTNSQRIWQYLSQFTTWRPYYHRVLGMVQGTLVPIPFNLNSLYAVFPERHARKLEGKLLQRYRYGEKVPILKMKEETDPDLRFLAEFVYEEVFLGYTLKQWGTSPEELDPSVTARVPVHISRDNRYFQDRYQGIPAEGYTVLIRRMLRHPNIQVLLNADYRDVATAIRYTGLIYTGPIDEYFEYMYGRLPYRSVNFEFQTLDQEWYQEVGTVNFPNEHDYTRITEMKHLTGQTHPRTTIVKEYPMPHDPPHTEPYYPVPSSSSQELYAAYAKEASKLKGKVWFAGRLGDYRYYNMDQAIGRALALFEKTIAPESR